MCSCEGNGCQKGEKTDSECPQREGERAGNQQRTPECRLGNVWCSRAPGGFAEAGKACFTSSRVLLSSALYCFSSVFSSSSLATAPCRHSSRCDRRLFSESQESRSPSAAACWGFREEMVELVPHAGYKGQNEQAGESERDQDRTGPSPFFSPLGHSPKQPQILFPGAPSRSPGRNSHSFPFLLLGLWHKYIRNGNEAFNQITQQYQFHYFNTAEKLCPEISISESIL